MRTLLERPATVKAARIDANQTAIVSALRAAGASVYIVGRPLDLLISKAGKTMLIEVKNPNSKYGKSGLNKIQQEFVASWQGMWAMVDGPEAALRALKAMES